MTTFPKYLLLFLFLSFSIIGLAQTTIPEYQRKNVSLDDSQNFERVYNLVIEDQEIKKINDQQRAYLVSLPIKIALENIRPFLAFSASWESVDSLDQTHILFQHSTDEENWSKWILLEKDAHIDSKTTLVSQLQFLDSDVTQVKFLLSFDKAFTKSVQNIALHFYNPGESKPIVEKTVNNVEMNLCNCAMPSFANRDDWCPLGCPPNPNPTSTDVTHLIVHHSATSNGPADWPAVVRSIWNQHVNVNGWSDIGYNWLIDPEGNLYEGRGKDVQGAHFCGTNARTAGVCVLGNFSVSLPSAPAISQLEKFLAWNSCVDDLDPLTTSIHASSGLDLHHISGHRDGCATECPGATFYPLFDNIRQEVAAYINENCNPTTAIDVIDAEQSSFQILPNPNSGIFTIQHSFMAPVEVELFSLDGKKIAIPNSLISNAQRFDLQHLPSGLYFLQLQSNGQSSFQKLLIH